jgi:UDP-glucuronate 4-epimerase
MASILVTGVTGQVAERVAVDLARSHEVVGVARFRDAAARTRLEAAGVRCVPTDLVAGEFDGLPSEVDALVNFAVATSQRWDTDLRANAEGPGLLVHRVRPGRVLHCSTTGVYRPAGATVLDESAPLGDNHLAISKIAAEAVLRTTCVALDVPTTIARLNVPYGVGPDGSPRGWPAFHLAMMAAGEPIPVHPDRPNLFDPIDLDDVARSVPALLDAASVPATVVNWAGPDQVSLEQWCELLAERTGLRATFVETDRTIGGVTVDTTLQRRLGAGATVRWREGFGRLADAYLSGS